MQLIKEKILIGMILVNIIIGSTTLTRGHTWGDDWAWYVLQAKSLSSGTTAEFMKQSVFTNTQSTTHVGPLAYPWGYPLILLPVYVLKGIHPLALKLPGLFFYTAFLVCLFYWMKPRLTRTESLLMVSLFAFNPLLIQFLDQILSDIPFLFFSSLTLLLMTRSEERTKTHDILIAVSVFLTTFLRATGIFLLGSFLVIEFFRLIAKRKERGAVVKIMIDTFVICFVFIVLWVSTGLLFPSGGETSYLSQFATLSQETLTRAMSLYFNVFSLFFGDTIGWKFIYVLLLLFFLIGAWTRRKDEPVYIIFFIVWLAVHMTYPYWQGPRYIFPLLPIFIYFIFVGMKAVIQKLPESFSQTWQKVFFAFWILIAGIFFYNSGTFAYTNLQNGRDINGPFDPYSKEVYQFINEKTSPESVVVFFKPRVMLLMTGHNTIMSMDCEHVLKGDYLVLSKKVGRNQQIPPEEIDACNLTLNKKLENNRFIVYEIQK